ncbi:MAG TPA: hypothetical protein VIN08_00125, partial [Ohtaekwangia sp.]|uniref:hypothetical protein n=1 Tax=Ohtaekwangia sp. TaxID=2066019 RepID=UPI002F93A531
MKLYIAISFFLVAYSYSFSQKIEYPKYKGTQSSFQNYVLSELLKADSSFAKTCDTSLGLVQFYINKKGEVKAIEVSSNMPQEIRDKLHEIILASRWSVMKIDNKAIDSLPIILPIYVSIELGCNEDGMNRVYGLEKDFREMLSNPKEKELINCLL